MGRLRRRPLRPQGDSNEKFHRRQSQPDFRYNPTQTIGEMAEWLKAAVC